MHFDLCVRQVRVSAEFLVFAEFCVSAVFFVFGEFCACACLCLLSFVCLLYSFHL